MNRTIAGLACLLAAALAAHAVGAAGDPVFGVWLTQTKDGKVRIAPCTANPAEACGTIIWAVGPKGGDGRTLTDQHNPDAGLRSRPVMGMPIIWDFRREGGGWAGGKIYDPAGGKTYKAKMAPGPNGTLKVAGCVLVFCRDETWTRAE